MIGPGVLRFAASVCALSALLLLSGIVGPGTRSGAPTIAPSPLLEGPGHPPAAVPAPTGGSVLQVDRATQFGLLNRSFGPVVPAAGGPPVSAIVETPPPIPPSTTPTIVSFPQAVVAPATCCIYEVFNAPVGTWGAIIFNNTGTAVNQVYDSSFRAYLDGNQILEGTTPEYGTWTVSKDLIQYAALFHGSVNLTFIMSAAVVGGHFVTNLSLAFYPVAPGTAPPPEPSSIVPLWAWNQTYIHSPKGVLYSNATVPDNATNATLQLFVYGFGPADEFWYSQMPGYRQVFVTLDGTVLATMLPFPYLNTGGIDLFMWRPVTGSFTLDDRPYEIDVTGALGLLEGTHELAANVSGIPNSGGNTWLIGGSLLLYTSAKAGPAASTAYQFRGGSHSESSGSTFDDSAASTGISYASTYSLGALSENVSTVLSATFSNDQTFSGVSTATTSNSHQNITMSESVATTTWRNDSSGSSTASRSLSFPFRMDLASLLVKVGSSGSTTTYNFTTAIPVFHQEWVELDSLGSGSGTPAAGATVRVDDLTSAAGNYSGREDAMSGGGASVTAIYGTTAATSKTFSYSILGGTLPYSYTHTIVAAGNNPPGRFTAELVLTDLVTSPMVAAAAAVPGVIDLGQAALLNVEAAGGTGHYTYEWSGLPHGCTAADTATLVCTPSSSGTSFPLVTVTDSGGNSTLVAAGPLTVYPTLNVTLVPERSAWDAGQTFSVFPQIAGGDGIGLSCRWSVNGSAPGPAGSCLDPLELNGSGLGPRTVMLSAADATGTQATSALLTATVNPYPLVSVSAGSAEQSSLNLAGGAQFNATVVGGSAPFYYTWSLNGTNLTDFSGPVLILPPTGPVNVSIEVWVTDAANVTVRSGSSDFHIGAVPHKSGSSVGGGGSTVDETGWYVALAAIAAAAVLLLFLVLTPRKPRPPPPRTGRPAQRRAAPPKAPAWSEGPDSDPGAGRPGR